MSRPGSPRDTQSLRFDVSTVDAETAGAFEEARRNITKAVGEATDEEIDAILSSSETEEVDHTREIDTRQIAAEHDVS